MKYVIYGLLVTLLGFVSSCADDKGNYDYQVINELDITGIETGIAYRKIAYVDTLNFSRGENLSVPKGITLTNGSLSRRMRIRIKGGFS
ncbi:MAG: hypothetical protein ACLU4J_11125 [Butyricimonas paravirosa]